MTNVIAGQSHAYPDDRFAIVVSRFNDQVTRRLLDGAVQTLYDHGVKSQCIDVIWVPGAWELPHVTRYVLERNRHAAVICLGAVIRGETSHDRQINRFVSHALGQLSVQFSTPVAFGVLTCDNDQQALARAGGEMGNKGTEAALAALEMAGLNRQLSIVFAEK